MKLPEVKKYLKKEKLDAIVLFNKDPCFNYFFGGEFDHGLMLLTRKSNYLLLTKLYSPKVHGFRVVYWDKFDEDLKAFAERHRIKKIGADYNNLLLKQKKFLSKHFGVCDASEFLGNIRQTKTKEEIVRIRDACRITDQIFALIIKNFKNFKTESDIMKFIKIKALQLADGISFEPIVASGRNAVIAHHNPDSKLRKGFLILDFGVRYKGYVSDMTRTLYLGKPSEKEVIIYNKALDIQKKCINKAKLNLNAGKLYNYSIRLFGNDAKYFVHGLGHGIGVEIHERPSFGLKGKDKLANGSIFTIEPGYYNQKTGIGIRIEDDVLLSGNKKEILTKSTKKLICIKGF
jgi:Xaa-Pro aminopeptidase